jgi:hypothetical protein
MAELRWTAEGGGRYVVGGRRYGRRRFFDRAAVFALVSCRGV